MQYPLPESIGNPDLLVGREKEFAVFNKWISRIPKRLSKSRAIRARRKSGKTALLQRIFNRLWSENGDVIPFYINISEKKMWLPDLAVHYFQTFASQYISFLERDERLTTNKLSLKQIQEYGRSKGMRFLSEDADFINKYYSEKTGFDLIWDSAATAPHRYAATFDHRFLVMIDEFQNTGEYIYRDPACETARDETMPGTWHDLSESKLAPMLVTGSYVGWLINIIDTYLEAGRLKRYALNPYLEPEAGLEAVYRYAAYFDEPITNETALQINRLCVSDPFFISLFNEFRSKKRFRLSRYFDNVGDDAELNVSDAAMRVKFQRPDGKGMEIDVLATSACGRLLAVEVKKNKEPAGLPMVEDFLEKSRIFAGLRPDNVVLHPFFSVGGFTEDAMRLCREKGIAVATKLELF